MEISTLTLEETASYIDKLCFDYQTESVFPLTKLPRTCGDCMSCENCHAELKAMVECTKSFPIKTDDVEKIIQSCKETKENKQTNKKESLILEDWYDDDMDIS
jgi:hypothetical protein